MSQNSPFNPPPFDSDETTDETPVAPTIVEAAQPIAPTIQPTNEPMAHVETVVPEPTSASRATNPLLAMLVGALLSCAMIGGGIIIGRQTSATGGKGVLPIGGAGTANDPDAGPLVSAVKRLGPSVMNVDTTFGAPEK